MKKFLTFFVALLFVSVVYAQPSNDECADAIHLGDVPACNVNDIYTNVDATESNIGDFNFPACFEGGIPDRDVWFSFTIPAGGINDLSIFVNGVGANSIVNPQVALYRGDCSNLQELFCASVGVDGNGETQVRLDVTVNDNATYYLRINEFSGSATPNWGDFTVCVLEFVPSFNMGDETSTNSCYGTLFDSGGLDGDYQDEEDYTFTICPDEPHQCIELDLTEYHLDPDNDFLSIYAGNGTGSPLVHAFSGSGVNSTHLVVGSNCVTVAFSSNTWVTNSGFQLDWTCSPIACEVPDEVTCDNPEVIASLPFSMSDLSTCYSGDNTNNGPCNGDNFLENNEYIFTYESTGDECIAVSVTGSNIGTGLAIYADCPDSADTCFAVVNGDFAVSEPSANSVHLTDAGTYYIVVGNVFNCTPFDITVTRVDCPITMPAAAYCNDALLLNGCGQLNLPAVISVAPSQGDETFLVDGVNDGCWGGFNPPNFTFFYFRAQADGNFGFIMESANANEASDIDFEVWGPMEDPSEMCEYARTHQPTRSSYAGGADPTGLSDIHPSSGVSVTDTCEYAGGDDFVSTIPVLEGEYYLVLINDYGDAIVSGAITIDFGSTSNNVLDGIPEITELITQDTTICLGDSVQFEAQGGEVYNWQEPNESLSCTHCPNPIAVPTEPTTYSVDIIGVCYTSTKEITVDFFEIDAGPDISVCRGEDFEINAGPEWSSATYSWTGIDTTMSCMDCPHPIITAPDVAGDYMYIVTLTGPSCDLVDTMVLHVNPGIAPNFDVLDDTEICVGESLDLGGAHNPDYTYSWSSVPGGFSSPAANPNVSPTETTEYFIAVTSPECAGFISYDSVTVTVYNYPVLNVLPDTFICKNDSILLGTTIEEDGTTYSWLPIAEIDNPDIANPMVSPSVLTQYTLTASNAACTSTESLSIDVADVNVAITPDSLGACIGATFDLSAGVLPADNEVRWFPNNGTLSATTGEEVVATPTESTWYFARTAIGHCVHMDSIFIEVDSLPDLAILPQDTMICKGADVTLTVPTFDIDLYSSYAVQWFPNTGLLTEETWFNAVVQPDTTTTYGRAYSGKYCKDTTYTTVIIIPEFTGEMEITADTTICPGSPVTLTVGFEEIVEGDFEWQPGGLAGDMIVVNPTETTTYTASFTDSHGCSSSIEASVTITVDDSMNDTRDLIVPDDILICPGTTVELSAAFDSDSTIVGTFTWEPDGLIGDIISVTPTQTTTYTVTFLDDRSCGIYGEASVTVVVDDNAPSDTLDLIVPDDITVCPGATVELTAAFDSDSTIVGTFTWEPGGLTGDIINVVPTETTTYTVTFEDDRDCGIYGEAEVTVTMDNTPSDTLALIVSDDIKICAGATVELTAAFDSDSTIVGTFTWAPSGLTGDTITIVPPETTTYMVTFEDDRGCGIYGEDNVTVTVIPDFFIDGISFEPDTAISGSPLILTANTTPDLVDANYIWQFNSDQIGTTNVNTFSTVAPEEVTSATYTVLITDSENVCEHSLDEMIVVTDPMVVFPNVFSPNGDKMNDMFTASGAGNLEIDSDQLKYIEFKVYSRWGELVYDNTNPHGWDGRHDGANLPVDTYVCNIIYEYKGKRNEHKGEITLIR